MKLRNTSEYVAFDAEKPQKFVPMRFLLCISVDRNDYVYRTMQRQKVIMSLLKHKLDVDHLVSEDIIDGIFPLHDSQMQVITPHTLCAITIQLCYSEPLVLL